MKYTIATLLTALLSVLIVPLHAVEPIDIGSRRELFVDHHLIQSLDGVRLVLHRPQPRESVLKFDQPWEGLYSGYETVLKDGKTYRFYYRGMPEAKHDLDTEVTAVYYLSITTPGISFKPTTEMSQIHEILGILLHVSIFRWPNYSVNGFGGVNGFCGRLQRREEALVKFR